MGYSTDPFMGHLDDPWMGYSTDPFMGHLDDPWMGTSRGRIFFSGNYLN